MVYYLVMAELKNNCIYIPCKTNTTYTIQKMIGKRFGVAYTYNLPARGVTAYNKTVDNTATNITITTDSSANYLVVYLRNGNVSGEITLQQALDSLQIEQGSTATEYEPYKSTSSLFVLDQPLRSLPNGVKDELVIENGIAKIIKRIGKVVLDGSENWTEYASQTSDGYRVYTTAYQLGFTDTLSYDTFLSNYFQAIPFEQKNSINLTKYATYLNIDNTIANTVAGVKAWLSTHNTIVYYELATPTEIEITDPTLLAQLNALEQITQYKHTYITITGDDLTPEADFTYINNVVINNTDSVLGKDTYWNDEVPTQQDLPSKAQEGEIRIVQDTEDVYIYNGTKWVPFDKKGGGSQTTITLNGVTTTTPTFYAPTDGGTVGKVLMSTGSSAPIWGTLSYNEITDTPSLSTVATSGNYSDLSNKPSIPTIPTNISAFENDIGYLTEHQDISGKEDKANKATSLDGNSTNAQYPSAKVVYDELSKRLKYKGHVNSKEDLPTAGQASGEVIAPNLSVSYLNGGDKSTVQKYYAKKQYFLSQFTNGSNYGVLSTDFPEIVDGVCLGFKPWGTTVFVHLNATGTKTAIIDYDSSNKGMIDYDDGSAWDKTKSTTITKSAWVALYRSPGYEGDFSGNFPNPIKFKIPSKDTFIFANGTDSVDVNYKSLTNNNFTYNSGYKLFEFPSDKDFKWVTTTPSDINENDVYTVGANYDLVRGNAVEQKWEPLAPKSDLYKTYTGYDETKTQVLKNINGTLTWVEETQN